MQFSPGDDYNPVPKMPTKLLDDCEVRSWRSDSRIVGASVNFCRQFARGGKSGSGDVHITLLGEGGFRRSAHNAVGGK